uniref:SFRICE_016035 n=1 Tax=Spodoptera frugiperda TaxID=7108 RepID=A0A2H1WPM3_SPOFR
MAMNLMGMESADACLVNMGMESIMGTVNIIGMECTITMVTMDLMGITVLMATMGHTVTADRTADEDDTVCMAHTKANSGHAGQLT